MALFALFHTSEPAQCREFGLVLDAVGIDSQITELESRYYLLVEEQIADLAYTQLNAYVVENAPEEHVSRPLLSLSKGYIGAYIYSLVLVLVAILSNNFAFGIDWQQAGIADSFHIEDGQWWRNFTALSLHADSSHLIGNIGFGIIFGLLVSQHIGGAAAWLSIILAGAMGNALNALLHTTLHQSIGASTMVFSALGMLGVFALNAKRVYPERGIRRWLPLLSTAALLVFVGTSGERTDILAHLTGYACGCLVALFWLNFGKPQLTNAKHRIIFSGLSFLIIIGAWAFAIAHSSAVTA